MNGICKLSLYRAWCGVKAHQVLGLPFSTHWSLVFHWFSHLLPSATKLPDLWVWLTWEVEKNISGCPCLPRLDNWVGALTCQDQWCFNIKLWGTAGLTPFSPLIQNKNNQLLVLPTLCLLLSKKKISRCSQHPHLYATQWLPYQGSPQGVTQIIALWDKVQGGSLCLRLRVSWD